MNLRQWPKQIDIRVALVAFGLVLLGCIWAGISYKVQAERRQEIAHAIDETANYARAFAEHTARTIKTSYEKSIGPEESTS